MTLESRIFDAYLETTSGRGAVVEAGYYEEAAVGLGRRLKGWLPTRESDILDLGCGLGGFLYLCQVRGHRSLTGVNLCADEIATARMFVNAAFHHVDLITFLRETEAQYDFIGCFNILEHLTKDGVMEALTLSASRLRAGGSLVAMVPNAISPFSGTTRYWDITHRLSFAPNNFRQLAPLAGFSAVEFRECGPVVHGPVSAARAILWQVACLFTKLRLLVEVADAKGGVYTMDMLVRLTK